MTCETWHLTCDKWHVTQNFNFLGFTVWVGKDLKIWRKRITAPVTPRGPESLKLSNSMTWSDHNCLTKGAYFAMFFTGKVGIFLQNFQKIFFLFILGTVQFISQIMRNLSSVWTKKSKSLATIGQFDKALSNIHEHWEFSLTISKLCSSLPYKELTVRNTMSNHWTV